MTQVGAKDFYNEKTSFLRILVLKLPHYEVSKQDRQSTYNVTVRHI